jgi:hypothetical protein
MPRFYTYISGLCFVACSAQVEVTSNAVPGLDPNVARFGIFGLATTSSFDLDLDGQADDSVFAISMLFSDREDLCGLIPAVIQDDIDLEEFKSIGDGTVISVSGAKAIFNDPVAGFVSGETIGDNDNEFPRLEAFGIVGGQNVEGGVIGGVSFQLEEFAETVSGNFSGALFVFTDQGQVDMSLEGTFSDITHCPALDEAASRFNELIVIGFQSP